jgi:hypothetical protein
MVNPDRKSRLEKKARSVLETKNSKPTGPFIRSKKGPVGLKFFADCEMPLPNGRQGIKPGGLSFGGEGFHFFPFKI